MSQEISRGFNNIYSELEILDNNISETYKLFKLLEFNFSNISEKKKKIKINNKNNNEKKNICIDLYIKNNLNSESIIKSFSDLEIENILNHNNLNKKKLKKRTKKKKRIMRSVMVLDTSSESESDY